MFDCLLCTETLWIWTRVQHFEVKAAEPDKQKDLVADKGCKDISKQANLAKMQRGFRRKSAEVEFSGHPEKVLAGTQITFIWNFVSKHKARNTRILEEDIENLILRKKW